MKAPKLNDELRKVFVKSLPSEFGPMLCIWFGERTYNQINYIENRQLEANDDIAYFRTGLEFMNEKQISVDLTTNIGTLYLNPNSIQFSVDTWLELEKQRLFYLLGIKEKAQEYLQIVKNILELNEIVDYHKTAINDLGFGVNLEITNFENLQANDIEVIDVTEESVTETIRTYIGDNYFYMSLKSYLHNKGQLTPKQIYAASKTIGSEILKLQKNNVCLKIDEVIESDGEKIDEIKSLIYRLEKTGYNHKTKRDFTIIYK